MRWSSRGEEAEEKQRSSDEEEPERMQSRGDQDEAVHKQPRADKDTDSAGLDHPGQNKKEWPKRNDTKGGGRRHDTPRTGASGAEHAARAAIPRTGTSEDKWRPNAPDWIVRVGPSSRNRRCPDWSIQGTAAEDAPRTGTSGAEQAAGATGSLSSGHEDEAEEMQQSRVEDEAGEKRKRQDEDKAKVTQ